MQADGLKEDDVRILGVGVGITQPSAELAVRALVTDNATDYIAVDDFGQLQESLDQIIAEVCMFADLYLLSFLFITWVILYVCSFQRCV